MALTQANRHLAIHTPLGEDVLAVQSFTGTERFARLFEYEADLLSEDHNLSFEDIVGAEVTVQLETTRGDTRWFHGIVSRFVQCPSSDTRYGAYRATIVPWLWLLTRTSDCRIWSGSDQTRTVPEIVEQLFQARGFDAFENHLTGSYTPWEYCVQYRETDFNFVSRLLEQEGISYYFKHEDGKHTLVLVDSIDRLTPFPGYDEISYRSSEDASTDLEHIRGWSLHKQLLSGSYVHKDFDFERPKKDLETEPRIIARAHAASKFEIYDYPGLYTDPGHGKSLAEIRIQEMQTEHALLHGQADARGLGAGHTVTLQDLPRDDQNRKYLVLSVQHNIRSDTFESGRGSDTGALFYQCDFSVMPADEVFRPARITTKPLIRGPQTAIVVGQAGEEIHTDEYGRVKVKFHWDRYGAADEKSSCWIRVAQLLGREEMGRDLHPAHRPGSRCRVSRRRSRPTDHHRPRL
jgi:type VI secretion system secreted protein VgrG